MEVKPGYKQTEVGVIPEEWDASGLGRFWSVTDCKHVTAEFVPNGFPVASIKEVQSRFVDLTTAKQTTSYFYSLLIEGGRKPCPGDLILSRNATVGEVAQVAEWHPPFAMGQDVCLLRKKSPDHSTEFLQAVFQSSVIANQLSNLMVGSTFKRVNVEQIRNFSVPTPPPPEQRAIAGAMSDVDALIGALDQLIAKKRDLKQAAMQQLLTGKKRLPGFHGEWETKTLFELADCRKELFDDGDWIEAEYLTESGIRLVQTGNIGEGKFVDKNAKKYISSDSFKKLGCKNLQIGDILICRLAEPAGRACILPDIGEERVITAVDVTIFRPLPSVADRRYLVNLFNTRQWFEGVNERCGGSTRTRIARGQLGKMQIRIPPLPEQTAIAEVLSDMDAEVATLEQRRDKTRALKQGMMQELLTGRIRLVESGNVIVESEKR